MARILIVDDSPTVLEAVTAMLTEESHEVHTFEDATLAVQAMRRISFDVVITDIFMPDHDGIELIGEIRKAWPELPVVAMSGATSGRQMLRVAKCLGARVLLNKPFSKPELMGVVRHALAADPYSSCSDTTYLPENETPRCL